MHDFARTVQHHKQRNHKKKHNIPVSKWLILLTLLLTGGLIFALTQLASVPAEKILSETQQKPVVKTAAKAKALPKNNSASATEEYDFYTLLPQSEVITPRVEAYTSKRAGSSTQTYSYLLQAGSFKSATEADRLRAKLILQGLNAQTSKVTSQSGTLWHRVLLGPFESRSKLNHAQDILAKANTESMVIKIKQ